MLLIQLLYAIITPIVTVFDFILFIPVYIVQCVYTLFQGCPAM